ncbi:protein kinase domain-containing protein [Streptosporangium sandarakinum]|uniref:non-specific serine/threonine protein kinase n=1 Tax=Streptosporangium sandarakinum TaxID=1260955 RepID=A0A852UXK2_9ACTN|nr:protein kinase [Streptosporangium sandarakinum]NYF40979.1 serine/threonine-protein kinase [Streptosporangium sandarakinum]
MTALLGGRYRPLGRIATGGMGEVWRARDELLGREVAVKLLRRHVAADPDFRERFRMEARIAAGLSDPGIAQVFDYGEADDVAYLVMELVPGDSLATILKRSGRLSAEDTLDMVEQTARALAAAHRSGIIHRDIKPGNLLVTETGTVKITDFGIARALEAAPMTQTGTVLGTAQYVSPEQASGERLTFATDVYSLGVVAYECLAGRPPFVSETQVAIALMHIGQEPPPLPESVPQAVRDLVMRCLAKDPGSRPAGAEDLAGRARALRESLTAAGATGLALLTDPHGWRAEPASEWPRDVVPAPADGDAGAQTPVDAAGADDADTAGAGIAGAGVAGSGIADPGVAGADPYGLGAETAGGARRPRRGLRRTTVIAATAVGCAAAVGLGALTAQDLANQNVDRGSGGSVVPVSPTVTASPSPTPTRPRPVRSRPSAVPTKQHRPPSTPSATVSTSATPSAQPSTSPTPSPTPTAPPPPPTPTAPPATPSTTTSAIPDPGETDAPNEET